MRYRFRDFEVDEERFELRQLGEPVAIQAKPLRLLIELLAHHPRACPRGRLLQTVWPEEIVTPISLRRAVWVARRALGASSADVLATVRGYGYRIDAPVRRLGIRAPLDRGFVGRPRELEALSRALSEALEGDGSLTLVSGEPGIGKTRLARELAAVANQRGARVVWAGAEQAAPAHWHWIQLLRGLVFEAEGESLRDALGPWAWDLRALVPELEPHLLPGSQPPQLEPELSRLRLFDSVLRLLRVASDARPLVLVLDDLHWADASSLDLLRFVARHAGDSRLLLLALHRDVGAPPNPALEEAIGDLARLGGTRPLLQLGGLSVGEVRELLASLGGRASADEEIRERSRELWERTGGNPFFVRELARLSAGAGRDPAALSPGVRAVVRERLRSLTDEALELLGIAALAGPQISSPLLARVCRTSVEKVLPHLERAESEGLLLRKDDDELGFAHDLIWETLCGELDRSRQRQLHLEIGDALEWLHGSHPEPHLATLAEHFVAALPLGDAERAEGYACAAARQARERHAFVETARHLASALRAHDARADATPEGRCDLLLELAEAQQLATDPASTATARDAASLARALGDPGRLGRAALALTTRTPHIKGNPATLATLEEALAGLPAVANALRVRLYAVLARERQFADLPELANAALACAQSEAARLGDPALDAEAALEELLVLQHRQVEHREIERADALLARGLVLGRPDLVFPARRYRIAHWMELGERDALDREVEHFEHEAEDSRLTFARHLAAAFRAMQASLDGREAEAERWIERCRALADPRSPHDALFTPATLEGSLSFDSERGCRFLESADEILHRFPEVENWRIARAWMLGLLGMRDEARRDLAERAARGYLRGPGSMRLVLGTVLAEAAATVGTAADCDALYSLLEPGRDLIVTNGYGISCFGPVAHYLGLLSGALGNVDQAGRDFETAIACAGRLRSPRWQTESRLAWASLLADAPDLGGRKHAAELVRLARESCERMDASALALRAAELAAVLGD